MTIFRFSLIVIVVSLAGVLLWSVKQEGEKAAQLQLALGLAKQCNFDPKRVHRIDSGAAYAADKIAIGGNYLDYSVGQKDERLDCLETALRKSGIDFEDLTIKARAEVPVP